MSVHAAKENRARRMTRNRNRSLMRKGCFPLVPIILCFWNISLGQLSCCLLKYVASAFSKTLAEPVVAFPKEYAALLKGTILDSLAPLFPLKHHLSSTPAHLSTWSFWYRDVFCSFLLRGARLCLQALCRCFLVPGACR